MKDQTVGIIGIFGIILFLAFFAHVVVNELAKDSYPDAYTPEAPAMRHTEAISF